MAEETFNTKNGAVDFGRDYEYLMAAYYALTLSLNDEIANFKISTNNNDMGDFDDVVIEFELQNGDEHVFAIQLKHTDRPIAHVTLLTGKKFGLNKYSKDFKIIQNKHKKNNSCIVPFKNFHFILFTNSSIVGNEDIGEKWGKLRPMANGEILKTDILIHKSDDNFGQKLFAAPATKNNWIYRFKSQEVDSTDAEFFDQFYFYTNQKNTQEMESHITKTIMKICQNYESAVNNYLNYFNFWCRQDYGTFKLTKKDVRLKLAELILTPYIPEPKTKMDSFSAENNSNILQMFSLFDITLIENQSEEMLNKIWKIVLSNFPEFAEWSSPLFGVYINQLKKIINIPISSLSENFNEISPKKLYLLLWHAGFLPLIIKSDKLSEENILFGIELTKNGVDKKKFILISKDNPLSGEKTWKILESLSDMYVPDNSLINKVSVSLQGRTPIPLTQFILLDGRLASAITISKFLSLTEDGCIGDCTKISLKHYINRLIPRVLVDSKATEEISDDLFVITTTRKEEEKEKVGKFQEICSLNENKNCHYVRFIDNERLEWIATRGSIKNLQRYRLDYKTFEPGDFIADEDALLYFNNKLNIVCADPGMGKTTMMKFLQFKCSSQYWVVTISLSKHVKFFKSEHSREEIFEYLLSIENDNFAKTVMEIFASKKQVLVLWDGFDEIPIDCVIVSVINTIKILLEEGILQWVAARNNSKKLLEETFSTFSLTITYFSQQDQYDYVHSHYQDEEQVKEVVKKMNANTSAFLNYECCNYMGVPLQIYMLLKICSLKPKEISNLQLVTLTDIYREFIQEKINSMFERADADFNNYLMEEIRQQFKNTTMDLYEVAAMKTSFEEEELLNVNLDCDELLEEIKESGDSLGLILGLNDNTSVFTHKTYEEFLAASWLSKHCANHPALIKLLFQEKYTNIRLMFDMLLAEDSAVHLAVLYKNLDLLKAYSEDIGSCKDRGGRNVLHIASSWGPRTVNKSMGKSKKIKSGRSNEGDLSFANLKASLNDGIIDTIHCSTQKVDEENEVYVEILKLLLTNNVKVFEKDNLLGWDAIQYAKSTSCLVAIDVMKRFHDIQ